MALSSFGLPAESEAAPGSAASPASPTASVKSAASQDDKVQTHVQHTPVLDSCNHRASVPPGSGIGIDRQARAFEKLPLRGKRHLEPWRSTVKTGASPGALQANRSASQSFHPPGAGSIPCRVPANHAPRQPRLPDVFHQARCSRSRPAAVSGSRRRRVTGRVGRSDGSESRIDARGSPRQPSSRSMPAIGRAMRTVTPRRDRGRLERPAGVGNFRARCLGPSPDRPTDRRGVGGIRPGFARQPGSSRRRAAPTWKPSRASPRLALGGCSRHEQHQLQRGGRSKRQDARELPFIGAMACTAPVETRTRRKASSPIEGSSTTSIPPAVSTPSAARSPSHPPAPKIAAP